MRRLLGVSIVLLLASACSLTSNLSGENLPREHYPVVVDYDQSLEEMIAAGNYDYVSLSITSENFPIVVGANGQVALGLELVHFNQQGMSSEQALAELNNLGFRPATLPELLALGAQYPKLQNRFLIVALGSAGQHWWGGDRGVPCLYGWRGERKLGLHWSSGGWYEESCRFLAVRR